MKALQDFPAARDSVVQASAPAMPQPNIAKRTHQPRANPAEVFHRTHRKGKSVAQADSLLGARIVYVEFSPLRHNSSLFITKQQSALTLQARRCPVGENAKQSQIWPVPTQFILFITKTAIRPGVFAPLVSRHENAKQSQFASVKETGRCCLSAAS